MSNYLVKLFNDGFDFAVKRYDVLTKLEQFSGVARKEHATHRLTCSRWNVPPPTEQNKRHQLREEHIWRRREGAYALSVLAVPLHRRKEPKQLSQKLKAPIDVMPVFNRHGSLGGMRAVLGAMVATHKHPTAMRRKIKTLGKDKCYLLYRVLRKASQRAAKRVKRQARRAAA